MKLFFILLIAALAYAENEKFDQVAFQKELDSMSPEELQEMRAGNLTAISHKVVTFVKRK